MTSRTAKLTLIAGGALLALQAGAQTAPGSPAGPAAAAETALTPSEALKLAAAPVAMAKPGRLVRITAAGSVILLADGTVARAQMAQIVPPAPGFVYER